MQIQDSSTTRITVRRLDGSTEVVTKPGAITDRGLRQRMVHATRAAGRGEIVAWEIVAPAPTPEQRAWDAWQRAAGAAETAFDRRFDDGGTGIGSTRARHAQSRLEAARAAYLAAYGEDAPSYAAHREAQRAEREARERFHAPAVARALRGED